MAEANVQYLELYVCEYKDRGDTMVESYGEDVAREDFIFIDQRIASADSFHLLSERYISFLNALRGNTYLERLHLSSIHFRDGIARARATALRENEGRMHFVLFNCGLDDRAWRDLVAYNPLPVHTLILAYLPFKYIDDEVGCPKPVRETR
jgi:hypothetical protein